MMSHRPIGRAGVLFVALAVLSAMSVQGQDRLKSMPGYEQFTKMAPQILGSVKAGQVQRGSWTADGKAFEYTWDGKQYRFEVGSKQITEVPAGAASAAPAGFGGRGRGGAGIERGRQATEALSPNGTLKAVYRDRNLFMADSAGTNESAITSDGSEKDRIKYGTASWVYGEELRQTTAMWWNPTSTKVAYYRFDEKPVPDFYLQMDQTKVQSALDVEAYPKAGVDNPIVDLFVYDVATKRSTKLDIRDGKPWSNDVVGHYVYAVRWSPDGKELFVNRTNRRQNIMEFAACSPETAKCRVVIREEWPTGWVENHPGMTFLADSNRFIWDSERSGFGNYYLYDLSGKLINTITQHPFEVANIVKVDEKAGKLWYMARDGDNYLKLQLHRVGLNGKGDVRLTDPTLNHAVTLSPDGKFFVDVAQAHDVPPTTRIFDASGKLVKELATSDLTKFNELGLKKVEMFRFTAADGKTPLLGMIHYPSNFDPAKKYPVLMPVYGGPASASSTANERWSTPSAMTEYGFIVVNFDTRAAPGQGKRTLDALYEKLGQTEMNDMAEGLKALAKRPYIDSKRVGVYGTSYGGYSSAMMLLRFPDLVAAAAASSAVTAWNHYDTIYTERFMWIPQENVDGYAKGSAMTYAKDLKGSLLIYYGTADNNVHPNNAMQLIKALQQAGKSFEVQVGPDAGHTGVNSQRMMEFFIENLVMKAPPIS